MAAWSRFVLYSSPRKLKKAACVPIAAYLTCCKKQEFFQMCIEYSGPFDYVDNIHWENLTRLPSVVRQRIDNLTELMWDGLFDWWEFHRESIINQPTEKDSGFEWIHLISWRADGTINYVQTARNLVESDTLSDEEKYRLACSYCFVEDIVRLLSKKHDHSNRMVNYWNCRMEGKIPEPFLVLKDYFDVWLTRPALDYFWEYLTDDQKIVMIVETNECIKNYFEYTLCKLNAKQLKNLIESHGDRVFDTLNNQSETLALLFWKHIKNAISVNGFYKIISAIDYEMASKIWFSASDVLKGAALTRYKYKLLDNMCHDYYYMLNPGYYDGAFIIELFSANSSEIRKTIWKKKWKCIAHVFSTEHLQIIMKLCLGSDEEVASFKETHMCDYSETECCLQEMVKYERLVELSEFLRFVTNDPEINFDLRIRVLKSENFLKYYIYSFRSDYRQVLFDEFVNETFTDADQLNKFKMYLITSEESMKYFRSSIEKARLHRSIGKFCEHVLSPMPDVLKQVKSWLLEVSRDIFISAQFECFSDVVWDIFLKWCLNGENYLLEQFKNTLPLDEIFTKLMARVGYHLNLLTCMQVNVENQHSNLKYLKELDAFLLWFFKDYDKIKDFKLSKLKARKDVKEIRSLFESNNSWLIDIVLSWLLSESEV